MSDIKPGDRVKLKHNDYFLLEKNPEEAKYFNPGELGVVLRVEDAPYGTYVALDNGAAATYAAPNGETIERHDWPFDPAELEKVDDGD